MIVKILTKSKTFKAVRYNTNKVEKNKGELLKVSGFEGLQGLSEIRPQDYVNYLNAMAGRNSRTVYPQFHAVLSSKGREMEKGDLVSLAENWLKEMGYGNQPYLLIYHNDTANNHIHMVSSRIDQNGKKISDKYEKVRAYRVLNKIIGSDQKLIAKKALENALQYCFSTQHQFRLMLEMKGYLLKEDKGNIDLFKFGEKVGSIALSQVDKKLDTFPIDQKRKKQLKNIFEKYLSLTDSRLIAIREPLPGGSQGNVVGYSSKLSEKLSTSFGLEFKFHFKDDKSPYGYTIIDHAAKQVYKGGEIMKLRTFASTRDNGKVEHDPLIYNMDNLPNDEMLLGNPPETVSSWKFVETPDEGMSLFTFDINISDDIDDEQINGRNRRRQKKARTNTR